MTFSELELEYKIFYVVGSIFLCFFIGALITSLTDIAINSDKCTEKGYEYQPRTYFSGEKKCVFNQKMYDRDVRSYTIE